MSAPDEREPLTPRTSLYDHALRQFHAAPDGRPPGRGFPLPDTARPEPAPKSDLPGTGASKSDTAVPAAPTASFAESRETARRLLAPLLTDPDAECAAERVHRALCGRGVREVPVRAAVADLPLEDPVAALALARRLVRHGTTAAAVGVGIGLLARLGEPEDVPYLRVLGLLRGFVRPVVEALGGLDRPAAALLWLGAHVGKGDLRVLVDALIDQDDPAARRWLLEVPIEPRVVGAEHARRISEAVRLLDLVRADPVDPRLLAQAGRLLVMMASTYDSKVEILAHQDAVALYEELIARAASLPPDLDHVIVLASLALELHSGASVLLDWPAGRREALLENLGTLLAAPERAAVHERDPAEHGSADDRRLHRWVRQALRQVFDARPSSGRLRVEGTVRDPAYREPVETRLLIDGRPLVPEHFGKGPARPPGDLLDRGELRATAEPHEVLVAEAWCTEGCCGALYVTIRREGEEVVWSDWRRSLGNGPSLGEQRFEALAYDAEIERAEADRGWEWPAAATGRLIEEGLRARPDLLTRWDLLKDWTGTDFRDPEATTLSFAYWPGLAQGRRDRDGPWLQFVWHVPEDGAPPAKRAAAVLHRLATEDPKGYAQVRGGSAEYARELGYPWPEAEDRR
ncbi:hypothetical protein [Streptomyces sp. NBC_00102]|uniref:hypothetical protein n=1 Tax=Streptomyces sp. NBC_00102 TaxID=2975652 RepID=UPI00225223EC|nr:hypothetical protein [Streptomyces sp. NBC_00102]MCX5396076.1 hypothetical protein [Streptomyces sp. NBC_00102]